MFEYISFRVFFISFLLGLFFLYILGTQNKIVYVYPTLTNSTNILFKDKAGQYFRFKSKEVECPDDLSTIKQIPIQ
uniref:Uncharacterized protein n=1 Tax=viral metagenome TaxID=1070528 RepID=A0A6C0HRZ0_9ZZZZ